MKMGSFVKLGFLFGFSFACLNLRAEGIRKYPVISSVQKSVVTLTNDEKNPLAKEKEILREKVTFVGKEDSVLRIDFSEDMYLVAKGLFKLEIPFVALEYPYVTQVKLFEGQIRVVNRGDQNLTVFSDLSTDQIFRGDYQFDYQRSVPRIQWTVIDGSLEVKGLEHESSVRLTSGQLAQFTGELDAGQVVYDVLLRGKRVARGKLSPPQNMSEKQIQDYKKDEWSRSQPKKPVVTTTTLNPKWICKDPYAEAFQCRLYCHDSKTVKQLCNANGQWGGDEVVAALRYGGCGKRPKLIDCSF